MAVCYIGIGSNLGDRVRNIRSVLKEIGALEETKIIKVSKFIETKPVGGLKTQPKFLNAALKINTGLPALTLLKSFKKIEEHLGRTKAVRNGPREIDLDILLYADRIIRRKDLIIPHPRMFKRDFVIKPLSEVIC